MKKAMPPISLRNEWHRWSTNAIWGKGPGRRCSLRVKQIQSIVCCTLPASIIHMMDGNPLLLSHIHKYIITGTTFRQIRYRHFRSIRTSPRCVCKRYFIICIHGYFIQYYFRAIISSNCCSSTTWYGISDRYITSHIASISSTLQIESFRLFNFFRSSLTQIRNRIE